MKPVVEVGGVGGGGEAWMIVVAMVGGWWVSVTVVRVCVHIHQAVFPPWQLPASAGCGDGGVGGWL